MTKTADTTRKCLRVQLEITVTMVNHLHRQQLLYRTTMWTATFCLWCQDKINFELETRETSYYNNYLERETRKTAILLISKWKNVQIQY